MANKVKGEFEFEAMGQTWRGRLDFNVIEQLEERFDLDMQALFQEIALRPRIKYLKGIFLFALQKNHPDLTYDKIGDVLQDVVSTQGLAGVAAIMSAAQKASFPEDDKGAGAEAGGHPTEPKPAENGTGQI